MNLKWLVSLLLIVVTFLVLFAGCAPSQRKRILWPVYPAKPRIEWLGTYSSQDDFPKTGWDTIRELVLGGVEPLVPLSPYGIVRDSQGIVYVADHYKGNLLVYNFSDKSLEYYSNDPIFSRPSGLAVDGADNLYVVDSELRAVLVFDKDRHPIRTIGSSDELLAPAYIAIDQVRARIYVSDPRANKIVIYDRFGKKSGEIGGKSGQDRLSFAFSSPQGMAVDKAGNLYVAELLGARISVYDVRGAYLRSFGERGDASNQFEAPKDIAFDSDGNLWVLDNRRSQIYTYNQDGVLLLATGTAAPSASPLGFSTPTAIYISPDDKIYVTDRFNRRFSVWHYFSERYLQEHPFSAAEEAYLRELGQAVVAPSPQLPADMPKDGGAQ